MRKARRMKLGFLPVLLSISVASAFAACGGSTSNSPAAPAADSGATDTDGGAGDDVAPDASDETAPPLDHGAPSTTYPAFKADMPQLNKNTGNILTAPVLVPVTWETDPNVTQIESFTSQIGTTDYWKAIVSEYGTGNATMGTPVHIPVNAANPLPTTLGAQDLDSLVDSGAGSPTTSGWPAPTAQTIYVVFIHPSITVSDGGTSYCDAHIGGYHADSQGGGYPYAINFSCIKGNGALDDLTGTASHEIGEATTDPSPNNGYFGFDNAHVAWSMFQHNQVENGDACEFFSDSFYKEKAPFAFNVQRLWSNAAAAAGKNPCVPAIAGPYFGAAPTAPEMVSFAGRNGATFMAKGFNIPVGQTKTFPVGFFSEAATSGAFSIRAAEGFTPGFGGPTTPRLTVSIDKTSGVNGEIAYVSVTVNTAGSTASGRTYAKANWITLLTSLGGATHFTPVLITNN